MTSPTYSVGVKGALAGSDFPNNSTTTRGVVLPDSTPNSNLGANAVVPTTYGYHATMRLGAQVLVRMPDGSQQWCVHGDSSKFDNPVLIPVGP